MTADIRTNTTLKNDRLNWSWSQYRAGSKTPVDSVSMLELYDAVELALRAKIAFIRDRHYVVRDKRDEPGQRSSLSMNLQGESPKAGHGETGSIKQLKPKKGSK